MDQTRNEKCPNRAKNRPQIRHWWPCCFSQIELRSWTHRDNIWQSNLELVLCTVRNLLSKFPNWSSRSQPCLQTVNKISGWLNNRIDNPSKKKVSAFFIFIRKSKHQCQEKCRPRFVLTCLPCIHWQSLSDRSRRTVDLVAIFSTHSTFAPHNLDHLCPTWPSSPLVWWCRQQLKLFSNKMKFMIEWDLFQQDSIISYLLGPLWWLFEKWPNQKKKKISFQSQMKTLSLPKSDE